MARRTQAQIETDAATEVAKAIGAGHVLTSKGIDDGTYTAGPYTKALGPATFVLFGYGPAVLDGYRHREGEVLRVAYLFVSVAGAERARRLAVEAMTPPAPYVEPRTIARSPMDHTSRMRQHIVLCRSVHCRVCKGLAAP
jgi:hypothetical protein